MNSEKKDEIDGGIYDWDSNAFEELVHEINEKERAKVCFFT